MVARCFVISTHEGSRCQRLPHPVRRTIACEHSCLEESRPRHLPRGDPAGRQISRRRPQPPVRRSGRSYSLSVDCPQLRPILIANRPPRESVAIPVSRQAVSRTRTLGASGRRVGRTCRAAPVHRAGKNRRPRVQWIFAARSRCASASVRPSSRLRLKGSLHAASDRLSTQWMRELSSSSQAISRRSPLREV